MKTLPGFLRLLSTLLAGGLLTVLPASVFGQARIWTESDLLRRPDIRSQLGLTETQTQNVEKAVSAGAVSREFFTPFLERMKGAKDEERMSIREEMNRAVLKQRVSSGLQALNVLDERQRKRLRSLYLAEAGIRALMDSHVAADVGLTDEQMTQLAALNSQRSEAAAQLGFGATQEQTAAFNTEWDQKFLAVLNPEQREAWMAQSVAERTAASQSFPRREIELSVTMIALDSSVDIPEVIESPAEFVAALRGQQRVRWSERFRLSVLDKGNAKMTIGSTQAATSGYTMQPNFRRPPDAASPSGPPGGATAPRSGFGTARSPVRASPNIVQEVFGTSVALQPSIQADGRILIEATLSSSRPDEVTESTKETDEDLVPKSFTQKFSMITTIAAASGKPVLLRTLESDVTGKLPGQTVLVVITATAGH